MYCAAITGINVRTVDHHPQRPSIADDAAFLDSLLELDRGLSGDLAARRRPWRTPRADKPASLDLRPRAPAVGERARGPSIGDAPPPSLPPRRPKPSAAAAPESPKATHSPDVAAPRPTRESFYGLEEKPFSASSDLKFLYHSTSFDRAMQDLVDALDRREGIVVLTGEHGTGKTTFCLSLIGQVGGSTRPAFLSSPPASVRELFKAVKGSAVIVIDEAQRLSVDVLQQLYRLSAGGRAGERLQIVLVGEPALLTLLRRGRFRGIDRRVRTRCRLDALMVDEMASYLSHRLAVAGPNARIKFDESAVGALNALSRGVPRVVNLVADRALTEGARIPSSTIDKALVNVAASHLGVSAPGFGARPMARAMSALLALVVFSLVGAAAAAWVFRDDIEQALTGWEALPAPPAAPRQELPPLLLPGPPAD